VVDVIATILSWLLGGGIAAIGKELREARLERMTAENDDKRIAANTRIKELEAEISERRQKLADPVLKLPLFLSELAVSVYIVAVMVDSTFPTEWLTPLRLPDWFVPHFYLIVASIFGISAAERFLRGKR
jgi:hypothetical protein